MQSTTSWRKSISAFFCLVSIPLLIEGAHLHHPHGPAAPQGPQPGGAAPAVRAQDNCAICQDLELDAESLVVTLRCTHTFHLNCIDEHLRRAQNPRCPVCRAVIEIYDPTVDLLQIGRNLTADELTSYQRLMRGYNVLQQPANAPFRTIRAIRARPADVVQPQPAPPQQPQGRRAIAAPIEIVTPCASCNGNFNNGDVTATLLCNHRFHINCLAQLARTTCHDIQRDELQRCRACNGLAGPPSRYYIGEPHLRGDLTCPQCQGPLDLYNPRIPQTPRRLIGLNRDLSQVEFDELSAIFGNPSVARVSQPEQGPFIPSVAIIGQPLAPHAPAVPNPARRVQARPQQAQAQPQMPAQNAQNNCRHCQNAYAPNQLEITLACGHGYHLECLANMLRYPHQRCNQCRAPIQLIDPRESRFSARRVRGVARELTDAEEIDLLRIIQNQEVTLVNPVGHLTSIHVVPFPAQQAPAQQPPAAAPPARTIFNSRFGSIVSETTAGFLLGLLISGEFKAKKNTPNTTTPTHAKKMLKRTLYLPVALGSTTLLNKINPQRTWNLQTIGSWVAGILAGSFLGSHTFTQSAQKPAAPKALIVKRTD